MQLIILLLLITSSVYGSTLKITEDILLKLAEEESPQLDELKTKELQAREQLEVAKDQLSVKAYAGYNHLNTNERATMPFMPVFSTINQYSVGVKKNFSRGFNIDLSAGVDTRSGSADIGNDFRDITTTIYTLAFNIDLWRDLFGKTTKTNLESAELSAKSSKIQKEIDEKIFQIMLRRDYWALVANNEKLKISNKLYKTAVKQANDAKKRKANSIADSAEVASYESQVAARKGSILYLEYERENLIKYLSMKLPALNNKALELGDYNLNKTFFEVMECTAIISKNKSVPYDYTKFDEVVNMLKRVQKNQTKVAALYDDVDISLSTKFLTTGVASDSDDNVVFEGSYQDSLDDMNNNDRSGFEAGIFINIPLGGTGSTATDVKKKLAKRKFDAQIGGIESNLASTHRQVTKSIEILGNVIKAQQLNSKKLDIRLKEMKKKYNQARIPEYALIQDQDALLNSDLGIIDTKLAIINVIFDYFSLFTETPCQLNRI